MAQERLRSVAIARASNRKIDAIAANRTPWRIPEQQHGDQAQSLPRRSRSGLIATSSAAHERPPACRPRVKTIAASTALGRLISSPVKNSRHSPSVTEQITSASGVRAPALSLTARLRQAPSEPDSHGQRRQRGFAAPIGHKTPAANVEGIAVLAAKLRAANTPSDVSQQDANRLRAGRDRRFPVKPERR